MALRCSERMGSCQRLYQRCQLVPLVLARDWVMALMPSAAGEPGAILASSRPWGPRRAASMLA